MVNVCLLKCSKTEMCEGKNVLHSQNIFIEKGSSGHARMLCMVHCRAGSVKPVHFRRSSHPAIRSSVASIYSSQPTTVHVCSLDSRSWLETVLLFRTFRRRFSRSAITC